MSASILIVVSDPGERESWKQLLTDQGYQTVAISTGERVPDLCAHLQPDLVLMQAGLPDVPDSKFAAGSNRIRATGSLRSF